MSFLSKIFGGAQKRIRKDAGELRLADFEQFPVWEFCHNEEGVEGQTECTMRPRPNVRLVKWPSFDGLVTADMIASAGRRFIGIVQPGESFAHPWNCSPEIVLDAPVGTVVAHPLLETFNQMMRSDRPRIALHVPAISPEDARVLVSLAYQAMSIRADEIWPLTIRPRVSIAGFLETWTVDGWLNAGQHDPSYVIR